MENIWSESLRLLLSIMGNIKSEIKATLHEEDCFDAMHRLLEETKKAETPLIGEMWKIHSNM